MTNNRIAILNLQVDANFGGHLQRYALITSLHRMGYAVEHLNIRFPNSKRSLIKVLKGCLKRLLLYPYYAIVRSAEYRPLRLFKYYIRHEPVTEAFYDKYIPHTGRIFSKEALARYTDYDFFVVGSDQVWRSSMASTYGLFTYLFDWLPDDKKRMAYGASLGTDNNELTDADISKFRSLYNKFKAVSVRENSGLDLLVSYDCKKPKAELVLDPTLLLTKEDYSAIIDNGKTKPIQTDIFCYVLDLDEQKLATIKKIAKNNGMTFHVWQREEHYTVEQWLRSFRDAKMIITDSYHGLVFSLLFNKQYKLLRNTYRGNTRFDSLAELLGVELNKDQQDYAAINKAIIQYREQSLRYLDSSLKL